MDGEIWEPDPLGADSVETLDSLTERFQQEVQAEKAWARMVWWEQKQRAAEKAARTEELRAQLESYPHVEGVHTTTERQITEAIEDAKLAT